MHCFGLYGKNCKKKSVLLDSNYPPSTHHVLICEECLGKVPPTEIKDRPLELKGNILFLQPIVTAQDRRLSYISEETAKAHFQKALEVLLER